MAFGLWSNIFVHRFPGDSTACGPVPASRTRRVERQDSKCHGIKPRCNGKVAENLLGALYFETVDPGNIHFELLQ